MFPKRSSKKEREVLIRRVKQIDEQITEENNKQFQNKIEKVVGQLRSEKGINGPKMWEVLKRVKRKKTEPPTAIKDKEGKILEELMIEFIEGDYDVLVSTTIVTLICSGTRGSLSYGVARPMTRRIVISWNES